jgi:hypothetical protein
MLGRRNTNQMSPRMGRRPIRNLSDSSCGSCESESLSPTLTRIHVPDDNISHPAPSLNSTTSLSSKGAISRCKSDQDATADIFDRDKLINCSNRTDTSLTSSNNSNRMITNGRRMCLEHKITTNND